MAKTKPIKLNDIDHDALYSNGRFFLRIPKAKTQGALRGTVEIRGVHRQGNHYYVAIVIGEALDGSHHQLVVSRGLGPYDDWYFAHTDYPTLFAVQESRLLAEIDQKRAKIHALQAELESLEAVRQMRPRDTQTL